MWRLSSWFFPRCPKLTFIGSPARPRGPGNEVSASYVLTNTFGGERVRIHCLPGYASQLYLAEYPERKHFLLLDCGCPSDFERVKFYLEDVLSKERAEALTLKNNLRLVVSSHCHIDHSGAAAGYHAEDVPIVRATDMGSSYQGPRRRLIQWCECFIVQFVAMRLGRRPENTFWHAEGYLGPFYPLPPAIAEIGHGDALPFGFDDWVTVKVPGHTTHMIGLYHTPSRIFYPADTVVKLRKGFFAPNPVDYDWAYANTILRLRKLDVGYLIMPHGGIVDVEDQYGSWNTVLENVVEHQRAERVSSITKKDEATKMRDLILNAIVRLLNSVPSERRKFTPADLDTGAMPRPWPEPAPVVIMDK